MSSNLHKVEFYRFVKILRSEGYVVVIKTKTKNSKVDGLVNFFTPIQIIIFLNRNPTERYKYALLTLLHECGHILDEKKYKNCERLKIYHKLINYKKMNYIKYCSKKEKKLFLYTEFLADNNGKILINNYNIQIDKRSLEEEQVFLYYALYNELVLNTIVNIDQYNKFVEFVRKTNFTLTKEYIKKLGNLDELINNSD